MFRAYDEGVAYRFETALARPEVKVCGEEARFAFAGDYTVYYPKEESFFSHNERAVRPLAAEGHRAATPSPACPRWSRPPTGSRSRSPNPTSMTIPACGSWGTSGQALSAVFPPYPLEEELEPRSRLQGREGRGLHRGDQGHAHLSLADPRHRAKRTAISSRTRSSTCSRGPRELADTSWIKPGKVAWDWWNANNVDGVDFKSGVNTDDLQVLHRLRRTYGIEYVILDEGWYPLGDVLTVVARDRHGGAHRLRAQKNVGLILWVVWKTLDDQFEPALDKFEKWGIKGIKVDFMQRDDQKVIDFYHKVCREAAKRKMLVDFHGAIRTGAHDPHLAQPASAPKACAGSSR